MKKLHIDQKSIIELFTGIGEKYFVIPDFQRPYSWDIEKCETLWEDIVDAYNNSKPDESYFLGTIVSNRKKSGNVEIIDGQQRIITLMLLLRVFFKRTEGTKEDVGGLTKEEKTNLKKIKRRLEECIWKRGDDDEKKTEDIHLQSKVATDTQNEDLHKIIRTGEYDPDKKDSQYHKNCKIFIDKSGEFFADRTLEWKGLCSFVMEKCIVLPIECSDEDTALTIFQTLNDRGLSLNDADIFKARIYQSKEPESEKEKFIEQWKELVEICGYAGIKVDDIFRYYSHILRAEDNDTKREVALRKFYSADKYKKLEEESLMRDLINLAKFWRYANSGEKYDDDSYDYEIDNEAKKWLQCLARYPNDYWKYITSVYFHHNKDGQENFAKLFSSFLKQMIRFLFLEFVKNPTVNAIKVSTFKACINIKNSKQQIFDFSKVSLEDFDHKLQKPPRMLVSALLLVHAYLNKGQEELIKEKLHIEHILPRQWKSDYKYIWNSKDAEEYLERFGNKVICDKTVNIKASDKYLGDKKKVYRKSEIANVRDLSYYEGDNWVRDDIEKREKAVIRDLKSFFTGGILS
jgi:uncharacterized protein with ParB-like and HNH nuclease domain